MNFMDQYTRYFLIFMIILKIKNYIGPVYGIFCLFSFSHDGWNILHSVDIYLRELN